MCNRVLSHFEEKILRSVHHDFEGLSIKEVAEQNGLTVTEVKTILSVIERKAPQLFPILTPRHREILKLYDEGKDQQIISEHLGISLRTLQREFDFLRKHKFLWPIGKILRYEPYMDGETVMRF